MDIVEYIPLIDPLSLVGSKTLDEAEIPVRRVSLEDIRRSIAESKERVL